MSYGSSSSRRLSRREVSFIKSHASKLSDLQPPGDNWTPQDIPEYLSENLRRYAECDIISRAGSEQRDGETVPLWETDLAAWDAIEEFSSDGSTPLPCNHSGFTNTGSGERPYECNTCGTLYSADQIEF